MTQSTSRGQPGHPGLRNLGFFVCFGVGLIFIALPLAILGLTNVPWSSAIDLLIAVKNFGAGIYAAILSGTGMLPLQGYASLWVGIVTLALGLAALSHQSFKKHVRQLFWARAVVITLLVTMVAASFLFGPGLNAVSKEANINTFFGIQLIIVVVLDVISRCAIATVGLACVIAFIFFFVGEISESGDEFWARIFGRKTEEPDENSLSD